MKKLKILVLSLIIVCITSINALASSPNYGKSKESKPIGLFFTGYVQCKPSYYDSRGGHAVFGWFQYKNTGDDNRYYTKSGKSKYDSNIYSKQKTVKDIWGFGHPKARFSHGFFWAGNGNHWPSPSRKLNKLNLKPIDTQVIE